MSLARHILGLASTRWFRVLALLGLAGLAVVSLYPGSGNLPRTRLPGPLEHFLAYLLVAGIAGIAFRHRLRIWLLAALMIAYAGALEIGQRWAPGRSASVIDFVGSAGGVLVGVALCALFLRLLDSLGGVRR